VSINRQVKSQIPHQSTQENSALLLSAAIANLAAATATLFYFSVAFDGAPAQREV
jgi:hypothetical protein